MSAANDCFLLMLVLSANFGRSFLNSEKPLNSTALPMKYSIVVTAVTGFAMLFDLLIIPSSKLPCIDWSKIDLTVFYRVFQLTSTNLKMLGEGGGCKKLVMVYCTLYYKY